MQRCTARCREAFRPAIARRRGSSASVFTPDITHDTYGSRNGRPYRARPRVAGILGRLTLARTSHEAVADHLENLQKLVSCVTPSAVVAELYHPASVPIPVTINYGESVSLRGSSRFQFALRQSFIAVDSGQGSSWRVVVRSFSYEIHDAMEEKFCFITGIPAATALSPFPICTWSKEHRLGALKSVTPIFRQETYHSMRSSACL